MLQFIHKKNPDLQKEEIKDKSMGDVSFKTV